MDSTFDVAKFVKDVGVLLVHAYEGARKATTPGLVGSAIENPVRSLVASLLPSGLSVGTGCVVDSYGNTSRQMDIVLYERDICPVYRVNDTPEATYFPCEGVVAVGEVKAALDGPKLGDAFKKIESVKALSTLAKLDHPFLRNNLVCCADERRVADHQREVRSTEAVVGRTRPASMGGDRSPRHRSWRDRTGVPGDRHSTQHSTRRLAGTGRYAIAGSASGACGTATPSGRGPQAAERTGPRPAHGVGAVG